MTSCPKIQLCHMRVVEMKLSMRLCDADSKDDPLCGSSLQAASFTLSQWFFSCLLLFFSLKHIDFSCFESVCANQSSDPTYLNFISYPQVA